MILFAGKVETREEHQQCIKEGFRLLQGFYYSKPVIVKGMDVPLFSSTFNSSQYRTKVPVQSIKQVVMLLGTDTLKKWLYVHSVEETSPENVSHSHMIIKTSLTRGKMCEQISIKIQGNSKADGYFLTGFLSLIDVITQRPSCEVIESLPLNSEIKKALRGKANSYRTILNLVIELEQAKFEGLETNLVELDLNLADVFEVYGQAIAWTEQLYEENFD